MGSITFGFLSESFLFNDEAQEDGFASFSDADLRKELDQYRLHVLSEMQPLKEEIGATARPLKFLAERGPFTTRRLMQSALYMDQIVLPDPLFSLTKRQSHNTRVMNRFHNMPSGDEVDRTDLTEAVSTMKRLTPMVVADYVKFFPLSYYSETNNDTPILYSETGFADVLPSEVLDQYRKHADVRSLRKTEHGLAVTESLRIGRRIAVGFRGHYDEEVMLFELFRNKVLNVDEEKGILRVAMDLPSEPPSPEQFLGWVVQSVHQTARDHAHELGNMLALSKELGSSYLTGSDFTYSILRENGSASLHTGLLS